VGGWFARTQVKWRRIVSAMFVYCKTGTGGKLVNEEDGLHYWLLFMAIADILLEVEEEETRFAHVNLYSQSLCSSHDMVVLRNERIDDFVCW